MRWWLTTGLLGIGLAALLLGLWFAHAPGPTERASGRELVAAPASTVHSHVALVTLEPTPTPRPVTVTASWRAPAGREAERYSEHPFERIELRYGERIYIERVCVSDARKITMISYTDAMGHTGVTLLLGNREQGRVDPSDRNCTLFAGVEVARLEKCKCWFQCAAELHECRVTGYAARPGSSS